MADDETITWIIIITLILLVLIFFILSLYFSMHATTGQTGSTGTTSDLCGPITFTTCSCSNDPIYNNFPHPLHTPASFAVFNFLNNGMHFPIYITVTATAAMQMQIDSN